VTQHCCMAVNWFCVRLAGGRFGVGKVWEVAMVACCGA